MKLTLTRWIENFTKLFAKLSLREQLLAVLASAVVLFFLLDAALIAPQASQIKELQQQEESSRIQQAAMQATLAELGQNGVPATGGATAGQSAADVLNRQIADAEALLASSGNKTAAGGVIGNLVADNPALKLVSLHMQPATEFIGPGTPQSGKDGETASAGMTPQKPIYKHGVQVALKGSYLSLLAFLQKLEHSPQQLFWSEAKLDGSKYPETVLSMTIFTLSDSVDSPLQ